MRTQRRDHYFTLCNIYYTHLTLVALNQIDTANSKPSMSNNKSCEARDTGPAAALDLSQKWLRYLRESAKAEKTLLGHIIETHPEESLQKQEERVIPETHDPIRTR